ncbi:MAG: DUF2520 domain-containing protein [Phaeodactylibacter sp.]|nr:DUF2520 domain-containing protein [Phaeodactylibacter sp.]
MLRISIIGAGNVATHLGKGLFEKGFQIRQIFSRQLARAQQLAQEIQAQGINDWMQLDTDVDLVLIAVTDDAISEVGRALQQRPWHQLALIAHTSGATPVTALSMVERPGIFYPLQSFSVDKAVDLSSVPFCLYASTPDDLQILDEVAAAFQAARYQLDDAQRAALHVAAVFANNFSNYLFTISHQLLEQAELPFDLLRPLILETAQKVQEALPQDMQTGPATRHDEQTISRHLKWLATHVPDQVALYRALTEGIRADGAEGTT